MSKIILLSTMSVLHSDLVLFQEPFSVPTIGQWSFLSLLLVFLSIGLISTSDTRPKRMIPVRVRNKR